MILLLQNPFIFFKLFTVIMKFLFNVINLKHAFKNYTLHIYLQYKYSKDRNRHWKRTYADGTLKPKVEAINQRLNKILEELKKNIKSTENIINNKIELFNLKLILFIEKIKI